MGGLYNGVIERGGGTLQRGDGTGWGTLQRGDATMLSYVKAF